MSREAAHEWSVQWVEPWRAQRGGDNDLHVGDPRVWDALLHLHGFDMTSQPERPNLVWHGPPGIYVHSHQHIVAELSRWRTRCADYDADPDGFRQRARERIEAHLAQDPSARRGRERALARIAEIKARQSKLDVGVATSTSATVADIADGHDEWRCEQVPEFIAGQRVQAGRGQLSSWP